MFHPVLHSLHRHQPKPLGKNVLSQNNSLKLHASGVCQLPSQVLKQGGFRDIESSTCFFHRTINLSSLNVLNLDCSDRFLPTKLSFSFRHASSLIPRGFAFHLFTNLIPRFQRDNLTFMGFRRSSFLSVRLSKSILHDICNRLKPLYFLGFKQLGFILSFKPLKDFYKETLPVHVASPNFISPSRLVCPIPTPLSNIKNLPFNRMGVNAKLIAVDFCHRCRMLCPTSSITDFLLPFVKRFCSIVQHFVVDQSDASHCLTQECFLLRGWIEAISKSFLHSSHFNLLNVRRRLKSQAIFLPQLKLEGFQSEVLA